MAKKQVKKEDYDDYRKDVCDKVGVHKPNHCSSLILSKLDEIIDMLGKCNRDNQEILSQSSIINESLKKKK